MGAVIRITLRRALLRGDALVLVAAAAVASLPSATQAACNTGYHVSRYGRGSVLLEFELLAEHGALASVHSAIPLTDSKSPPPCRGAFCSGKSVPNVPPVPMKIGTNEVLADLAVRVRDDRALRRNQVYDELGVIPTHVGGGIFHPPRAW